MQGLIFITRCAARALKRSVLIGTAAVIAGVLRRGTGVCGAEAAAVCASAAVAAVQVSAVVHERELEPEGAAFADGAVDVKGGFVQVEPAGLAVEGQVLLVQMFVGQVDKALQQFAPGIAQGAQA